MYKLQKYDIFLQAGEFLRWIEDMALEGWFIQDIHEETILIKFKKDQARRLRYSLYHHEYKKAPSEDFLDAARDQGWELVGEENLKKQLFLFRSSLEDPIPLETDPEEIRIKIKQSINRNIFNVVLYVFILSIWFYRMISADSSSPDDTDAIVFIALYGFQLLRLILMLIRRKLVSTSGSKWNGIVSRISIQINRSIPLFIVIVLMFFAYRHTHAEMVKTTIVPDAFVTVSEMEGYGNSTQNELMTASQFSFDPSYTYFYQIPQADGYTISLYQTRQSILKNDVPEAFISASTRAIWMLFGNVPLLKVLEESPESITYWQAENGLEYLTLFLEGNVLYTLHTVNLDLKQHQTVVERMGQ